MSRESDYGEGRYIYCIVNSGKEKDFGQVGVEDNRVYVVAFNDIGAVVHSCEAKPYKTDAKEKASEWILSHQYVIDLATNEFDTVIPLTFDTIFKGNNETLKMWLSKEYEQLKALSAKLKGKAEYGVQVFLENDFVDRNVKDSQEIQNLEEQLKNASSGVAYLLNKNLKKRRQIEQHLVLDKYGNELCAKIEKLVDDLKLGSLNKEVPEEWKGKQMILNITCLAQKDKIENLGTLLGQLKKEGFAVRFTGPWPPYSFVGKLNESKTVGSG
jgi:hypothetical protein